MSIESIATALHHSKAKGTAKLILIGIANHDGDGGSFPAMATLARYAGVDIRNARNAVRRLEELGEIRTFDHGGNLPERPRNYQPNRYEFLVRCPDHCDGSKNHRDRRKPLLDEQISSDDSIRSVNFRPDAGIQTDRMLASDKPSFNQSTHLKKETYVIAREESATSHIYADSGWCITCAYPNEHKQLTHELQVSA